VNLPADLPAEQPGIGTDVDGQAEWEKRATLLAKGNSIRRSASPATSGQSVKVADEKSDVCESN
jgi:hypothetical protein